MISPVASRGIQASHSALMNIMVANNDPVSPRLVNHNKTSTRNLSNENHQGLSFIENLNNLDAKLDMNLNQMPTVPRYQQMESQQWAVPQDKSSMNFRSRNP